MNGPGLGRILVGIVAIVSIFALFGYLLTRARRTHSFKVGGRSFWEIICGGFPRIRRRK